MQRFPLVLGLLIALAGAAHGASQMWEWTVDEGNGPQRHITDRPPPPHLKNVKILRRPTGSPAAPVAAAPSGPVAVPALAASGATGQAVPGNLPVMPTDDKELVARKKQAEAAEEARKQQEAQAQARIRADNCTRAQTARTALDSGQRIAITRPDGQREILDDSARAAEMRRIQASIASNCGG